MGQDRVSTDAFRSDSQRQAQELYEIIEGSVHDYAKRQANPSLSALVGALATVLGQCLATVPAAYRPSLRTGIDRTIRDHEGGAGLGRAEVKLMTGKH